MIFTKLNLAEKVKCHRVDEYYLVGVIISAINITMNDGVVMKL